MAMVLVTLLLLPAFVLLLVSSGACVLFWRRRRWHPVKTRLPRLSVLAALLALLFVCVSNALYMAAPSPATCTTRVLADAALLSALVVTFIVRAGSLVFLTELTREMVTPLDDSSAGTWYHAHQYLVHRATLATVSASLGLLLCAPALIVVAVLGSSDAALCRLDEYALPDVAVAVPLFVGGLLLFALARRLPVELSLDMSKQELHVVSVIFIAAGSVLQAVPRYLDDAFGQDVPVREVLLGIAVWLSVLVSIGWPLYLSFQRRPEASLSSQAAKLVGSLEALLHQPTGYTAFHTFLESEFAVENVRFWRVVEVFRFQMQCTLTSWELGKDVAIEGADSVASDQSAAGAVAAMGSAAVEAGTAKRTAILHREDTLLKKRLANPADIHGVDEHGNIVDEQHQALRAAWSVDQEMVPHLGGILAGGGTAAELDEAAVHADVKQVRRLLQQFIIRLPDHLQCDEDVYEYVYKAAKNIYTTYIASGAMLEVNVSHPVMLGVRTALEEYEAAVASLRLVRKSLALLMVPGASTSNTRGRVPTSSTPTISPVLGHRAVVAASHRRHRSAFTTTTATKSSLRNSSSVLDHVVRSLHRRSISFDEMEPTAATKPVSPLLGPLASRAASMQDMSLGAEILSRVSERARRHSLNSNSSQGSARELRSSLMDMPDLPGVVSEHSVNSGSASASSSPRSLARRLAPKLHASSSRAHVGMRASAVSLVTGADVVDPEEAALARLAQCAVDLVFCFDSAQEQIFDLMQLDSYQRFKQSPLYSGLLADVESLVAATNLRHRFRRSMSQSNSAGRMGSVSDHSVTSPDPLPRSPPLTSKVIPSSTSTSIDKMPVFALSGSVRDMLTGVTGIDNVDGVRETLRSDQALAPTTKSTTSVPGAAREWLRDTVAKRSSSSQHTPSSSKRHTDPVRPSNNRPPRGPKSASLPYGAPALADRLANLEDYDESMAVPDALISPGHGSRESRSSRSSRRRPVSLNNFKSASLSVEQSDNSVPSSLGAPSSDAAEDGTVTFLRPSAAVVGADLNLGADFRASFSRRRNSKNDGQALRARQRRGSDAE